MIEISPGSLMTLFLLSGTKRYIKKRREKYLMPLFIFLVLE
ncbi:hypothetical protein PM8797T_17417 [Gimesia maris DSM 8797]|nr:hypothetical protein PM8797T_17417 [Gimesia maris DSM 8797]